MKIFSNFDTKLRENKLKEYQDHFGVDKVLLLRKSKLYLLVKVFPKLIVFVLVMLSTFFVSDWIVGEESSTFILYIML
jgi:hypothetical protein